MKKIVFIILAILCLTSCGVSSYMPKSDVFKMGESTYIHDYKVFQTLDDNMGLAKNALNGMIVLVKSSTQFAPIYDGEEIKGSVVMIDTYSYESLVDDGKPFSDGRPFTRTVPIVIPYNEYKAQTQINSQSL